VDDEQQFPGDDAPARLRSLATLAAAVARSDRLVDLLELAAEEARTALGAASVTIGRWERDSSALRTLVSVGASAPIDQGRLVGGLDDVPLVRPARDDEHRPSAMASLYRRHGSTEVAVPIMVAGRVWGEVWANSSPQGPELGWPEVEFLQKAADHLASAISQAEHLSEVARLAYEDPLTGLANRRALDERLDAALRAATPDGPPVTLLVMDVDGLKEINDRLGHDAGDAALRVFADALRGATGPVKGALASRIGGDEFCVLFDGHGADTATALAQEVLDRLHAAEGLRVTASCGVAVSSGTTLPADLFRMADAAQYTAKRSGRGRIAVSHRSNMGRPDPPPGTPPGTRSPWRVFRDRRPGSTDELLVGALGVLDGPLAGGDVVARMEAVATQCAASVGAARWVVSGVLSGRTRPEILIEAVLRTEEELRSLGAGQPGGEPAPCGDADVAVQRETAFTLHRIDPDISPAMRDRLIERGADSVLMAGARHPSGGYVLELFADERSTDLHAAEPAVRLLVLEAVHGAGRSTT
jgi:diguanylate cyclase (GGDEF)-like protein